MTGVLQGLHAAHEAKSEQGEPLHLVHRDVSPQNVLVGIDGVARVVDFGVAKAAGRLQTTRDGHIKGKACYMAPEQVDVERAREIDRRVDVFAASIVLWELLAKRRLFEGSTLMSVWVQVMQARVAPPSEHAPEIPPEVDAIVLRGLARKPADRFATALEMATLLENAAPPATTREVSEWVQSIAGDVVKRRAGRIAEIESYSAMTVALPAGMEPGTAAPAIPIVVSSELSQVSSISVSASKRPPDKGRPRVLPFVAAALALVVGVLAYAWARRTPTATVASAPPPPSAAPEPSATASAPPPEPPAVASAPAPPPPARKKPAPAPAPKKSCNPPYTIDPMGVRVPKPECY